MKPDLFSPARTFLAGSLNVQIYRHSRELAIAAIEEAKVSLVSQLR